jgi:hypothetical protein
MLASKKLFCVKKPPLSLTSDWAVQLVYTYSKNADNFGLQIYIVLILQI